jgi:hypothetical protein
MFKQNLSKIVVKETFNAMENYPITINIDKEVHCFEVGEYVHHEDEKCKSRVFKNGIYVASLEPDPQDFLHICQNPGQVEEEILWPHFNQSWV